MNKDSIYKIIGYKGEYNKEVKAKLRSLLKKYHPDHNNGKDEIFKLINNVKRKIENENNGKNKETVNCKNNKRKTNDDFDYYKQQIDILIKKNIVLESKLNSKMSIIEKQSKKYSVLDQKINEKQELLCANQDKINYFSNTIKRYFVYIMLSLFLIIVYFITQNIFFIGIVVGFVSVLVVYIFKAYFNIRNLIRKNNDCSIARKQLLEKIDSLKKTISNEKKNLLNIKREYNKNNNDIRFYQNQLKRK